MSALDTPYAGLVPYEADHTDYFFGRDRERRIITANLTASRLTLLYGESGVGKSSVLAAGVQAHLQEEARENTLKDGAPGFAVAIYNRWQDDPVVGLSRCAEQAVQRVVNGHATELVETNSGSLAETFRRATERVEGSLLIILDQFEEYFLYHPHDDGPDTFAAQLPSLIDHADLQVSFMISIREDMLARLDYFKASIPNIFDNYYRIEHLNKASAREAIEKPLKEWATRRGQEVHVEAELVDAVLDQVRTGQSFFGPAADNAHANAPSTGNGQTDQIEAPFLQLVMKRLWSEEIRTGSLVLRRATLDRLKGAREIVRAHLDKEMSALLPEQQEIAARMFYQLVTSSGTKIAHSAADLATYAKADPAQVGDLLRKLAEVRILRPVPGERYEIFHDVLAPAVLDWHGRYEKAQAQAEAERELHKRLEQAQAKHQVAEQQLRFRLLLTIVGSLIVLLIGATAVAVYAFQQRGEAMTQKNDAEIAKNDADAARRTAERDTEEANIRETAARNAEAYADNLANLAIADTRNANDQLTAAKQAQAAADEQKLRLAVDLKAVDKLDRAIPHFAAIMRGHELAVRTARFSPDGKQIVTSSDDGTARVWDASSGTLLQSLRGHTHVVNSAAFSHDGRLVVTASSDKTAKLWDAHTGAEIRTFAHRDVVQVALFSPDDKLVAAASQDGETKLWDPASGQSRTLRGGLPVHALSFSADGSRLAAEMAQGTGYVWDVASGQTLLRVTGLEGPVAAIALSPDGARLLAETDTTATVWDVDSKSELYVLEGHSAAVSSVAFSPDGKWVATGSHDSTARVWNADTGAPQYTLSAHGDKVSALAFSPDSVRLVTGSEDSTAIVWDLTDGTAQYTLRAHAGHINSVEFSTSGNFVLTASSDRTARVWEASPGTAFIELLGHTREVGHAVFSRDGRLVATAAADGTARVWNATDGTQLFLLKGH